MSAKQKLLIIEQTIEWTREQIYVAENIRSTSCKQYL